ncbi:hypothetical protein KXR68_12845 [Staphylococcus warneri]|uniref:hypothetical protein n=1 Tax=Staphylococcus warneri TaxID=1292 RepID=UPI003F16350C
MFADFCWVCPNCKTINDECYADEDKFYECDECGKKSALTFSVDVESVELYEEPKEKANMLKIGVSRDKGRTWEEIDVNTRDLNPATSPLNPGDLIKAPNGSIWLVWLDQSTGLLRTKKGA